MNRLTDGTATCVAILHVAIWSVATRTVTRPLDTKLTIVKLFGQQQSTVLADEASLGNSDL